MIGPVTSDVLGGLGAEFPTDQFSYESFLNIPPVNENENYGFSGQVDWSLGAFTLT